MAYPKKPTSGNACVTGTRHRIFNIKIPEDDKWQCMCDRKRLPAVATELDVCLQSTSESCT